MYTRGRGDQALRRHRVSLPDTCFFLTLCLESRHVGLNENDTATAITAEIARIETDGHWRIRAGVIMPDHLHLLVHLAGSLSVARCVARLKSKTNVSLSARNLSWQGNFYEHRLRPNDAIAEVIRYIFLNPYRDRLVRIGEPYRWFWLGADESAWFKAGTDQSYPFAEWLR